MKISKLNSLVNKFLSSKIYLDLFAENSPLHTHYICHIFIWWAQYCFY